MGVEEQRVGEEEEQFPIGMRVLAVDDDAVCLMLLETLLRRCQYKVTATSEAITALRMLRERKDDFDLVISDVHMPDMDGFKLLEHVGLEMDLPVIMLSAHSDPKLVMKGITHGACDYLLKPVRMEEFQNIWQHVIRRKSDTKDQKSGDKARHGNDEGIPDQNLNKKRKDQMEDEEDDSDNDEAENEDPKTQKKARVVWSSELHGRFLAAVKQLGLDKAVPKRILDLMRVDNITRENVASHLQKFRLGLKKFKTVADQHVLVDGSYLHTGSIDGSHFQNAALRGHPNRGMLRRLNSSTGLGVHDLPPLRSGQFNHIQAPGHLTNDQSSFQHNILHGMPISMGLDDETHHGAPQTRDLPRVAKSAITFPLSSGFSGEKIVAGSSDIPFLCGSNKPSPFEGHSQHNSRVDFPCRVDSRGCNTPQTTNYIPQLENYKIESVSNAAGIQNSTSCWFPINQAGTHLAQSFSSNELLLRSGLSSSAQSNWTDRLAADAWARPNNGCTSGQQCLQGNYDGNSGSLEDLVGAKVKQDRAW